MEYYLECIVDARELGWSEVAEKVVLARNAGASWHSVGEVLGMSATEAQRQFGRASLAPTPPARPSDRF